MTRYLIDITRFISRIGRGKPTGIDRVEIAYLSELSARDPQCLAVAKMGKDYVLLTAKDAVAGMAKLQKGDPLGRLGLHDFYRLKLPKEQRQARQYFRSVALKSSPDPKGLFDADELQGIEYVNVGHSNLTDGFLSAVSGAGCTQITAMVHDMIPLDFPEYTKAGMSEQFAGRMQSLARYAQRIICNSADTQERVKHYFGQWGATPVTVVAHLGVERMQMPRNPRAALPYFVCLGTIEPRKNHMLLFKIWEQFAKTLPSDEVPGLHIVGRRGWNNEDVFRFLDTSPLVGTHIFEASDFNDTELAKEISQSAGLLFPSHAEGFGLPALEAAQMGVPVLCSDLPVFREILDDAATFMNVELTDDWAKAILSVAQKTKSGVETGDFTPKLQGIPRWESHFCHVFGDT